MEQDTCIDFFVSYTSRDGAWAVWLAWQLEQAGYTTVIQAWDFQPGSSFVQEMDTATKTARRTLAVLSPNYFRSNFTPSEWQAAFRRDPTGEQRLLVPVRVQECDVEGLLGRIVYIDLVGQDEQEAGTRLLGGVRNERAKPSKPPIFPTSSHVLAAKPSFPDAFPPIWMVPYPRNLFFTGREEILTQLTTVLNTGSTTALTPPQAISGLGGIGKTQIAVEYAYRSCAEYQAVFWVRADTRENVISDFVTIAGLLKLPEVEKDMQDQQIAVQAIKQWLSRQSKWLLILDNADELSMVREFLPLVYGGHLLLTTQAQAMGRFAQRIEVDTMPPETGTLFLLRRAALLAADAELQQATPEQREQGALLVHELGGLPLALDQAGAYVEETPCSLAEYLKLYRSRRAALLARRGGLVTDHPASVAITWSLAFAAVKQAHPEAADLLHLCAFLHPDLIPEELLRQGLTGLRSPLQALSNDDLAFHEAVRTLGAYSLIRRDPSARTLSVHRLVQAVLLDTLTREEQLQTWFNRAAQLLWTGCPETEEVTFAHWQEWERLLPHALAWAALLPHTQCTSQEAAHLLRLLGLYLSERGRYAEAEPLLRQALTLSELLFGQGHTDTAKALAALALLNLRQGRYPETEALYQRTLATLEQVLGLDHPSTSSTLGNLALLYQKQGRYREAKALFLRILAMREQALKPDHTTSLLNNLAVLFQKQERYEEAEALFLQALSILEQALGPDHPHTAATFDNLAQLYMEQGRYEKAEPLFQRALAMREQALGPDHPNTGITLNNLAILYKAQRRYEEAEALYQRVLVIYKQALGSHHTEVATTLQNLAQLYKAQGRYEEAKLFFQSALAMREQALPATHPRIATTLENYASLLRVMGRSSEALLLEQRARVIRAKQQPS